MVGEGVSTIGAGRGGALGQGMKDKTRESFQGSEVAQRKIV